jgi:hypothetical protein
MVSSLLIVLAVGGVTAIIYAVGNHKRLVRFSSWLTRVVNNIVSKLTRGKKEKTLDLISVEKFFTDLHQDYLEIMNDKKILAKPFIWAVVANILDVVLLSVAFLSLGYWVSPAILFIAFGISSIVSVFSATPGGAGIYEAIMIAFLASAGTPPEVAIAGTLLARTTLLIGTVIFGYIFYQLTINKYGKATK